MEDLQTEGNCELNELVEQAKLLVTKSREPATVKVYIREYNKWNRWRRENVSTSYNSEPGALLGLYLTHLVNAGKSVSSLNHAFYGIKWMHKIRGTADPTEHPLPNLVLEGGKRNNGRRAKSKKPADKNLMKTITEKFGQTASSLRELRFASMCLVAFHGFLRFNETSRIKLKDLSFKKGHLEISLPSSKTDIYSKGDKVIITTGVNDYGNMQALHRYLGVVKNDLSDDGFVFRTLIKRGKHWQLSTKNVPVSYSKAREELHFFLKDIVPDHADYGLHSFRSGGATTASENGVTDRLLKKHGRWKSESAKDKYIHESLTNALSVTKNLS